MKSCPILRLENVERLTIVETNTIRVDPFAVQGLKFTDHYTPGARRWVVEIFGSRVSRSSWSVNNPRPGARYILEYGNTVLSSATEYRRTSNPPLLQLRAPRQGFLVLIKLSPEANGEDHRLTGASYFQPPGIPPRYLTPHRETRFANKFF